MLRIARRLHLNVCTQHRSLATAVKYSEHGAASSVYKLQDAASAGALGATEVALKFIAAPINPADINIAEGVYGVSPKLPAIGGSEGVAVVEQVGASVQSLKAGDWVLPRSSTFGTWRQEAKAEEKDLLPVPNDIPAAYAATIMANPGSAYRMLRDFAQLKPGDVIIQNGANSMVGLAVVQMARELGLKTINIVRTDRPEVETTIRLLSNLGGDVNITDAYLNTADFNEIISELPPCKLALNCVGGEVATNMARVLAPGGTMVTYGGMSKQPVSIPFELLAYKQLKLRGFWMAQWAATHSVADQVSMVAEIAELIRARKLSFFFRMHDLDDFPYALQKAQEPFSFRKVVLNLNYPDRMKEHDERDPEDYKIFDVRV